MDQASLMATVKRLSERLAGLKAAVAKLVKQFELDRSIEEFELSARAYNGLKNANINTIADLVEKSEKEMLNLHVGNFGKVSLNEIKVILTNLGLSFKPNQNMVRKQ